MPYSNVNRTVNSVLKALFLLTLMYNFAKAVGVGQNDVVDQLEEVVQQCLRDVWVCFMGSMDGFSQENYRAHADNNPDMDAAGKQCFKQNGGRLPDVQNAMSLIQQAATFGTFANGQPPCTSSCHFSEESWTCPIEMKL